MKKLTIATMGLCIMISSVNAEPIHPMPLDELQASQWSVLKDKKDETLYYRTKDVSSKKGIWLKSVDKDDQDTEYKHYQTHCAGTNDVIKDAEIEVKKNGTLKHEIKNDKVEKITKANTIRSLICGK